MLRVFSLFIILNASLLLGDVKSVDGLIRFDSNSDASHEMILNQTGLGIGTLPSGNLEVAGNAIVLQSMSVGSNAASQNNLQINGSFSIRPSTVGSGNISLSSSSLVLVDTSDGDKAIVVPLASQTTGRIYTIKKISTSGNLHLSASGNLIDQNLTITLEEQSSGGMDTIKLISDGEQWWVLNTSSSTLSKLASSNLLLEYQLDEKSGAVAMDASLNDRHAFLDNSHLFSGNSVSAPQTSGLSLDDEKDTLYYRHGEVLISNAYSWSFWVNSVVDPDLTPTFSSGQVNQEVFGFSWMSSNTQWKKVAFHKLNNDTYVLAQVGSDIAANTWVHLAGIWNGAELKVYLNGNLEATTSATSLKTQNGTVTLRNSGGESNSLIKFDHFQMYDKALSASEVWALYGAGNP